MRVSSPHRVTCALLWPFVQEVRIDIYMYMVEEAKILPKGAENSIY